MRILVVVDDPNLGTLWGRVLESLGHDVQQVETEKSAVGLLETAAFDLVVQDLCLQGRKALAVAMMAPYRNPACKVVAVSGSANSSRRILCETAPAVTAVLHKPVDIEDLVEACGLALHGGAPSVMPAADACGAESRA